MQIKATFLLSIGLLLLSLPVLAGPPANAGAIRIQIEGFDNCGWIDAPLSPATITCPGGELMLDPFGTPYCPNSNTGRLNLRDGVAWSCMIANDPRMTGVGLLTSNANFDADYSGSVWGKWMIVPTASTSGLASSRLSVKGSGETCTVCILRARNGSKPTHRCRFRTNISRRYWGCLTSQRAILSARSRSESRAS